MRFFGKRIPGAVAVLSAALLGGGPATAQTAPQEGSVMVRLRALYMVPINHSTAIPALGIGKDEIHVNQRVFPEFDVSYFFTPNIATELVLTYPQRHQVTLAGNDIGSVSHLPPTLLVQYHLTQFDWVRPYVGAGLNFTWFIDNSLSGGLQTEKTSFGPALQVGADFKVAPNWFVNLDVKKVWIGTDINVKGTNSRVSHASINPWLFSFGVGYRF